MYLKNIVPFMGEDSLGRLNWGNYDLVVIDESHNFRNGGKIVENPPLTNLKDAINYNQIFEQLVLMNLDIYRPSHYILPSKIGKYAEW